MNKPIPYGKQFISPEDITAVTHALQSDFLTQGPQIAAFEKAFANYIGSAYAVAVANGTAALHLSALALKVKKGQKVITTPITFAASANCIKYCGGEVVFADIEPETYLLDVKKVRQLLENSPKGTYAGIVPVDFAGRAVNLQAFKELANEYNLWIIEDACHAPGGFFTDSNNIQQNCGNGAFADLAIFSFHPVKHIACGEGGMITTNDKALYEKLLVLRTHGITRKQDDFINEAGWANGNAVVNANAYPGWYMEMQELGYNYRLTDFQAALGISQLQRADEGLLKRRKIAATYTEAFKGKKWVKGQSGIVEGHAYHLYIIEAEDRLGLYNYLKTKNIFTQVHYIPAHLMPFYKQTGYKEGDMPYAETYYSRCLSLPMYPTLTETEQEYVITSINIFTMSNIAIITARGGSKRIPYKNIKAFRGKPIIAYSIEAAIATGLFELVMVSTDDEEIAEVAKNYGAKIPFLRSAATADDFATTSSVLVEVINQLHTTGQQFTYACCIYPTAPFVTSKNLQAAFDLLTSKKYASVFPVCAFGYPVQRGLKINEDKLVEMMWPENLNKRSQDLVPVYHDAGQFYWVNVPDFSTEQKLFTSNSGSIILNELQVQDIDNETDWKIAELKHSILFPQ